jgi:hypothetical protein
MWIWRRLHDDSGFPAAMVVNSRRFWSLSKLIAWERKLEKGGKESSSDSTNTQTSTSVSHLASHRNIEHGHEGISGPSDESLATPTELNNTITGLVKS